MESSPVRPLTVAQLSAINRLDINKLTTLLPSEHKRTEINESGQRFETKNLSEWIPWLRQQFARWHQGIDSLDWSILEFEERQERDESWVALVYSRQFPQGRRTIVLDYWATLRWERRNGIWQNTEWHNTQCEPHQG